MVLAGSAHNEPTRCRRQDTSRSAILPNLGITATPIGGATQLGLKCASTSIMARKPCRFDRIRIIHALAKRNQFLRSHSHSLELHRLFGLLALENSAHMGYVSCPHLFPREDLMTLRPVH